MTMTIEARLLEESILEVPSSVEAVEQHKITERGDVKDQLLELFPTTIQQRIKQAVSLANYVIENQDVRYTERGTTRRLGKALLDNKNKLKVARRRGQEFEIAKLKADRDFLIVMLFVRKKLGNNVVLETPLSYKDLIELQNKPYLFN